MNFLRKKYRPVTERPRINSGRNQVFIKRVRMDTLPKPVTDRRVELCNTNHRDPDESYRNKHFPAKTHDLVVTIPWESRTKPKEQKGDRSEFPAKPNNARNPGERRDRERCVPSAKEHDYGQR